jgi:hypothetical protein
MNQLTAEQIAIIQPVLNDLEDRYFDIVGRLDEKEYLGEFKVEAYKAALFLHRDNNVPQYPTYKHIRQNSLKLNDLDVAEEYNIMNKSVMLGMNLVKEALSKPVSN